METVFIRVRISNRCICWMFTNKNDECNFCYPTAEWSLDEAKEAYKMDTRRECIPINFIET